MKFLKIILCSVFILLAYSAIISAETATLKAVVIEGNTLFNSAIKPHGKPYKQPYTEEELVIAKTNAERGSKLFLLAKDGTLYYPTPKKGETSTIHLNQ